MSLLILDKWHALQPRTMCMVQSFDEFYDPENLEVIENLSQSSHPGNIIDTIETTCFQKVVITV